MLKIAEWQNEKDTLHRLAQILGKHKLASAFQEPQCRPCASPYYH